MNKTVCELFAGVGGFRLGLENLKSGWKTVWFSQWEPQTKAQWAYDCYVQHFGKIPDVNGEYHNNEDISTVDKTTIPKHTLLVAGFPCQDFSVANGAGKGIEGKKGVLWWQVYEVIKAKKPAFCLFENVDRLLKSPAKQRGRDFGIILTCLAEQGYSAEWRVINAAVYGAAQRRRRVFIFAYRNNTSYAKEMQKYSAFQKLCLEGMMAKAFPVIPPPADCCKSINLRSELMDVSNNFSFDFDNAGYMQLGIVNTLKLEDMPETARTLGSVLETEVAEKYFLPEDKLEKWKYLKGAKKIPRVSASGYAYTFSEGAIAFPDPLDKPSRTMLTSEGTLNRSSHIVRDKVTGRLRKITPMEAERLQGFSDGWTDTGMSDSMRYFCMGNALVVDMISRMGRVLDDIIEDYE